MTNIDTTDSIQIDGTEIERVTKYTCTYLGQTIPMENRTRQKVSIRIKAGWNVFGKYRKISLDRHLPMNLKRKVFNQCVLPAMTYGCQTWSLTKVLIVKKLETSQRAMERKMLNVKLKVRTCNAIIIRQKSQSDRHSPICNQCKMEIGWTHRRMKDRKWTIRSTERPIKGMR